ncbi:MAG: ankyrin repeat domain-containing protein, partial [Acidobacteria bacterium]|nr:ankyrin repeat domain-containing protein [Candidatus Sulfomarinibacter kjeldsenii]
MNDNTTPAVTDASPEAPRLTMALVLREIVERFFDVDKGWLRTARDLTLGPGAMIRRYVQGHRKVYANPFAYLVVGTAVNIMTQKVVGFQERMVATASGNVTDSPLQSEFINRFTELISQNALYVSIGIVVPLALLVRLFFRRSGYNLAECFVFALYSVGHLSLLGFVLLPLYMLLPPSAAIQGIVGITVAIIYTVYVAKGFFSGGFFGVAIKTCVAYLIAYLTFFIVMMVCVITYIFIVLVPTSSGVEWDLVNATDYESIPVIEKLLDEGADIDMTLQRTALHAAAANGNLEIVDLLIERGADVNLKDIHGRVPMFVALAEHQPEVAARLAEADTNPNVRTVDGSTLLMAAVRAEEVQLVQWALDHGTDVNAIRPEKNNATALILAARKGNAEIVSLLLAAGADPDVANHEGETALDIAKGKDVKELLRTTAERPPSE